MTDATDADLVLLDRDIVRVKSRLNLQKALALMQLALAGATWGSSDAVALPSPQRTHRMMRQTGVRGYRSKCDAIHTAFRSTTTAPDDIRRR